MSLDVLELVYQRLQLFVIAKYFLDDASLSFGVVERVEVYFVDQFVGRKFLLHFDCHVCQIRDAMRVADLCKLQRNVIFELLVGLNQLLHCLVVEFVIIEQLPQVNRVCGMLRSEHQHRAYCEVSLFDL